jgi:transcriptional regulator with XRE-family HTH domain
MAQYTEVGKMLRKIRIDSGEVLRDMAGKLGVSSSYLSAVEVGTRKMPQEWLSKINEHYQLNEDKFKELQDAFCNVQVSVSIDLADVGNAKRKAAIVFARTFDDIDDETAKDIIQMLRKKGEGDE